MHVLVLTTLYPTPDQPVRARFMPGRLGALALWAEVSVVLPQQTFPLAGWFRRAPLPPTPDDRFSLTTVPFTAIPGVARDRRGDQLAGPAITVARQLHAQHPCDVVLGHFLWPDGVGAAKVARELGLPHVLVAHGSDVNQQLEHPARLTAVAEALSDAGGLITVSGALARQLQEFGLSLPPHEVIPCGYDPAVFHPRPRDEARAALGVEDATWLVYVGMLRDLKRVDVLLEAMTDLRDARLAILGAGPEAERLADQARRLKLGRRVLFAGPQPHDRVALWMAAADAVVLVSEREGTPTVLVEALACGTPVVATAVGGIPELTYGLAKLAPPGEVAAFVAAVQQTLAAPPDAAALTERVAKLAWPEVGAAEAAVLAQAVESHRSRPNRRPVS